MSTNSIHTQQIDSALMFQRTTALRDELLACDNPTKWLSIVTRLAKRFGLSYCSLMAMPKPSDRFFSQLVTVSNLPSKLVQCYDKHSLLQQCPSYGRLAFTIQPQIWTASDCDDNNEFYKSAGAEFDEFQINSGIMISLATTSGERYILRFEGTDVTLSEDDTNALLMQSTIAFDHFQFLRRNSLAMTKNLTKREVEVVKWTAQGKTSSEIAAILTLSDHTVNAYMNNAIKKLECVNRTQLVAKAIRLKLIS